jgi:hypothetical protein
LIAIDLSQIKNEKDNLSNFLKSKIQVIITVKGDSLFLDTGEEEPPIKSVKLLLKKFLSQKGLEDRYIVIEKKKTYSVIKKKEAARIVKQKHGKTQNTGKNVTPPSPNDLLPYFFPNRPRLRPS